VDYVVGDPVTCSKGKYKNNQNDWSPPITYFQVAASYNLGKDNLPLGDSDIEI
jgi:hypothetical protein